MLSLKAWKIESVLRLLAVLFLGLALVGLASSVADRLSGGASDEARRSFISLVGTVVFQLVTLGVVGWFLRDHGTTWSAAFGLRRGRVGRQVLLAVGATVTVVPISLALMWVSQQVMTWASIEVVAQPTVRALQAATSLGQRLLFGAMAILLAPVAEEVIFRGILYPTLKELGYPRVALWLTAVVFAFTHANLVTFLSLTFFAVALTSLYEHTDSLWVPIGTHSLFNLANFAWLLVQT